MLRAALAFVIALVTTPVIRWAMWRWNVVDVPNARSSHHAVTPRGGGLGAAIAIVVALLVASVSVQGSARAALLVAGIAFGAIGLLEDLVGVPALRRLALLFAAAVATLPWLLDALTGAMTWRLVFAFGVVVWLVAFVNSFNFMDGINGLAVGQVVVAALAWFAAAQRFDLPWLEAIGLILAGGALGFLPYNAPRALVFLGDVGSYFLGAVLAATAVLALRAGLPFEAVFAPLALYLADTGATLVRRVRARECWYEAHHDHVYQRLYARFGESHVRTTLLVLAVMATCAALGQLSLGDSTTARLVGDIAIVGVLTAYLLAPGLLERVRRREPVLA